MRRHVGWIVCAATLASPAGPDVGRQASPDGRCEPGIWDLETTNAGATAALKATSTHYCLFDGRVEMAEYRSFGPGGQLNFAGVSFYAFGPDRQTLTTLWLMVGDPGFALLPTTLEGDRTQRATGWGEDGDGKFLERATTTYVSGSRNYHFANERSYDDGRTWRNQASIDGVFRSATVPGHAATLREGLLRIRGSEPPATSVIILDGLAELATDTIMESGTAVDVIRFSSAYGPAPGHWRTVTWRAGQKTFATDRAR